MARSAWCRQVARGLVLASALHAAASPANEPITVERDGARVRLSVIPEAGPRPIDGGFATIELAFTALPRDEALRGIRPAVWLDVPAQLGTPERPEAACRDRVAAYLKGSLGHRPLVDLNGYYLLVMNRDPSISVIDPIVGVGGRTSLLTSIVLPRPAADWAAHPLRRRLVVTMPRADQAAIVDTTTFRTVGLVNTGREPVRVVAQQQGPLAFVGNNADGTVTVVDLAEAKPRTTIAVGAGHHELELVERMARLWVTNRADRTVTVVDTGSLAVLRTIRLDGVPSAVTASTSANAVYVSTGTDGRVTAFAAGTGERSGEASLGAPVDAIHATPDGRFLLALGTNAKTLTVLDAANLAVRHRIVLPAAPYQLVFTGEYAHVRMYDTERVAMVPLGALAKAEPPTLGGYAAGTAGPRRETVAVMAPGLAPTPDGSAMLVVNPADGLVHYYMEGMNAPAGTFRNYGHPPQAVRATDRALTERAPGTYTARLRMPAAGDLDVALWVDQPRIVECFRIAVDRDPQREAREMRLVARMDGTPALAREPRPLRIRVADEAGKPATLPDASQLRYYRAPGVARRATPLRALEPGLYEADVTLDEAGAYYLQIDTTARLSPPFFSLLVRD